MPCNTVAHTKRGTGRIKRKRLSNHRNISSGAERPKTHHLPATTWVSDKIDTSKSSPTECAQPCTLSQCCRRNTKQRKLFSNEFYSWTVSIIKQQHKRGCLLAEGFEKWSRKNCFCGCHPEMSSGHLLVNIMQPKILFN